jgi:hypothetical protein
MKFLPVISIFLVGLIFATIATFFAPVASNAGHYNSVAAHHAKYILYIKKSASCRA